LKPPSPTGSFQGGEGGGGGGVAALTVASCLLSSRPRDLNAAIKSGDAEGAASQARLLLERRTSSWTSGLRRLHWRCRSKQEESRGGRADGRCWMTGLVRPAALGGRGAAASCSADGCARLTRDWRAAAPGGARAGTYRPAGMLGSAGGLLASDTARRSRCTCYVLAIRSLQRRQKLTSKRDVEPSPAVPAARRFPLAMEPVVKWLEQAKQPQAHLDCPVCTFRNRWPTDLAAKCAPLSGPESAPSSRASSDEKGSGLDSREPTGQRRRGHNEGLFRVLRPVPAAKQQQQQQAGSAGESATVGIFCCPWQNCPLASRKPGRGLRASCCDRSCHLRPESARLAAWLHHGRAQSRQSGTGDRRQPPPCLQLQDGSSSSGTRRSACGGARANSRLFSLRAYAEPEGAATSSVCALPEESLLAVADAAGCDSRSCGPLRLVMPRTACIARPEGRDAVGFRPAARDSAVLTYLVTSNPEHWPPKKDHLEQLKAAVRGPSGTGRSSRREDSEYDEGSAGSVGPPQPQQPEVEEEPRAGAVPSATPSANEPVRPGCQMSRATLRRRALRTEDRRRRRGFPAAGDSDDEENKAG
uniref:SET domain-containing protein n=1 Tax=Macrostomum lignano TaxID=282301 RepID=A0A1I8FQK2_9PLAT